MKRLRRFTAVLFVVATCGSCNAGAQTNEPGKSWHYMEQPVLPAPPPATEEQLKRGEALLNTLLKIAANVRLTDSAAVMKELGVDEIHTQKQKNHYRITPKRPSSIDLRERGFENMAMTQMLDPHARGGRSSLDITVLPQILCITPKAVESKLGHLNKELWVREYVHPTAQPPKQQPIDGVHFSQLDTPDGRIGSFSAEFTYQECATYIRFGYPSLKSTETNK